MKSSEPSRRKPISRLPSSIDDIGDGDQANLAKNYKRAQRGAKVRLKQDQIRFGETWFGRLIQSPKARWLIRDGKISWDLLIMTTVGLCVLALVAFPYLRSGLFTEVKSTIHDRAKLFHEPDEAVAIIGEFYAATSVEQQLKLVRAPSKVEPLMRAFYQDGFVKVNPADYVETTSATILKQYGKDFSVTGFTFLETMRERVVCIEDTPEGPKVDWETAVSFQPIKWTDFKGQQSRKPYWLRCIATKSDYFNYQFEDPAEWTCYHLRDPYGTQEIYGYMRTDSELRRRFDDQMRGTPVEKLRGIFSVRFPDDPKANNMVEITNEVVDDWFFDLSGKDPHPLLESAQ